MAGFMEGEGLNEGNLRTCVCSTTGVCVWVSEQTNIWFAWKLASLFRYFEFQWLHFFDSVYFLQVIWCSWNLVLDYSLDYTMKINNIKLCFIHQRYPPKVLFREVFVKINILFRIRIMILFWIWIPDLRFRRRRHPPNFVWIH